MKEETMKTNVRAQNMLKTHEGGPATPQSPIKVLRRSVMANLLWESNFYEDGQSVTDRIKELVPRCSPTEVAEMAIEARTAMHLRHVPLLLVRELARSPSRCAPGLVAETLEAVIQRADELTEFLALYWKEGRRPISKQVKTGLARAFKKFNAYQLAKYNRDGIVKLRDVLFLTHAKPETEEQAAVWKQLVDGTLLAPDTWEVALSAGADKKETFERLLSEKKLGYLALLRNLRNMQQAGVDQQLIFQALLEGAPKSRALPFRFVAAAAAVPAWEPQIDEAMQRATADLEKLPGSTVLLVDVSGSMDWDLSAKSDLTRIQAAGALAVLAASVCEQVRVFTFSNKVVEVPPTRGMPLIRDIQRSQPHGGTYLGKALSGLIDAMALGDRLIVFTDEQSADPVGFTGFQRNYMVNVSTNANAVGYGAWTRIYGFSEAIMSYIAIAEKGEE